MAQSTVAKFCTQTVVAPVRTLVGSDVNRSHHWEEKSTCQKCTASLQRTPRLYRIKALINKLVLIKS